MTKVTSNSYSILVDESSDDDNESENGEKHQYYEDDEDDESYTPSNDGNDVDYMDDGDEDDVEVIRGMNREQALDFASHFQQAQPHKQAKKRKERNGGASVVQRKKKAKSTTSEPKTITVGQRLKKLHMEGHDCFEDRSGDLFCSCCCKVVAVKNSTIQNHVISQSHKDRFNAASNSSSRRALYGQLLLTDGSSAAMPPGTRIPAQGTCANITTITNSSSTRHTSISSTSSSSGTGGFNRTSSSCTTSSLSVELHWRLYRRR